MTIELAIVGDIRLYCEGLARVLDEQHAISVVALLSDPEIVLQQVCELSPQVVLIDTAMPLAFAIVRQLHDTNTDVKIVALSVAETRSEICRCAESGVAGFVARDATLDTLLRTIRMAVRDEVSCSPRTAGYLLRQVSTLACRDAEIDLMNGLTSRQVAVLEQISAGKSNKEIARCLGIELATAKNHVHQILEKLNVRRRGEAAAMWTRRHPHYAAPADQRSPD